MILNEKLRQRVLAGFDYSLSEASTRERIRFAKLMPPHILDALLVAYLAFGTDRPTRDWLEDLACAMDIEFDSPLLLLLFGYAGRARPESRGAEGVYSQADWTNPVDVFADEAPVYLCEWDHVGMAAFELSQRLFQRPLTCEVFTGKRISR